MKTFFRIAALFDWLTGMGLILDPQFLFRLLGLTPTNTPGLLALFGCIVLVFGWVFWQVSRNPSNRLLLQVALLGKVMSFTGMILAILFYKLPPITFLVGLVGDGFWIPPFWYFYRKMK